MNINNRFIQVRLRNGKSCTCPPDTSVKDLIAKEMSGRQEDILGALVNNDAVSLSYRLEVDSTVKLLTIRDSQGWRIYRRSVSFLLSKAVHELFPDAQLYVEHSLGTGFYCNFERDGKPGITKEELHKLDSHMRSLVNQRLPIERRKIYFKNAIDFFEKRNLHDKLNLLRFKNPPKIVIYSCGKHIDLSHGPLADNTASLARFKLIHHEPGFVIQFPDRDNPPCIPAFERQPHLFEIFREHKKWGRVLGVRNVGDLNEINAKKEMQDFIQITEAFHEKKISSIADMIAERRGQTRWILIAGPSSSGKTTFAKRLAIECRVNGLRTATISVDNYFVDRDKTPRLEDGSYDFEALHTIDLPLFNEHLQKLDRGECINLPHFNFAEGRQEFRGDTLQLDSDQVVLIEGIHSLNPELTQALPDDRKFKIYISALTQLNLDHNNRISTTDNRLVRRMVRDNQFRGNTAEMTLNMWPRVREGEKKWIFPYQQEADVAFNSALDYELAVLKQHVEPLLAEVKPYQDQYADARRLMEFMSSLNPTSSRWVPPMSILREFIGQSSFQY